MTVYDNIAFGLSNIKGEMAKVDFDTATQQSSSIYSVTLPT